MKRGVGRFGPGFGKALSLTAGAATRKRAGSLLVSPVSCPSLSVQSVQENKRDEGRNTRQYERSKWVLIADKSFLSAGLLTFKVLKKQPNRSGPRIRNVQSLRPISHWGEWERIEVHTVLYIFVYIYFVWAVFFILGTVTEIQAASSSLILLSLPGKTMKTYV